LGKNLGDDTFKIAAVENEVKRIEIE